MDDFDDGLGEFYWCIKFSWMIIVDIVDDERGWDGEK